MHFSSLLAYLFIQVLQQTSQGASINCSVHKKNKEIFFHASERSSHPLTDTGNSSYECRSEQVHAANSCSMRIISKSLSFNCISIYALHVKGLRLTFKAQTFWRYVIFPNACHMIVIKAQLYAHHLCARTLTAYPKRPPACKRNINIHRLNKHLLNNNSNETHGVFQPI